MCASTAEFTNLLFESVNILEYREVGRIPERREGGTIQEVGRILQR